MNNTNDTLIIPVGPGGTAGRVMRVCLMFISGGFLYPNSAVEGMNLTAIQAGYEGTLYSKDKTKPGK